MNTALVYGLAVAGAATVRALATRGVDVVAADDADTPARRRLADDLGVELLIAPDDDQLAALVERSDVVVPAPGVPEHHRVIAEAQRRSRRLVSELELAYEWEQERPGGPRPILADHRHGRQDDDNVAHGRHVGGRWLPHRRGRQHRRPARHGGRPRRRCLCRRVHELPAGLDAAVPRRGGGVAEPGT